MSILSYNSFHAGDESHHRREVLRKPLPFCVADALFDRLIYIMRAVELSLPAGKQCYPMASLKGLGFSNEYELSYVLG